MPQALPAATDTVAAAVRGYEQARLALLNGVDLASRAQVRQARLTLAFALVKARQASDTRLFEGHGDRGSEPVLRTPPA